MARWDEILTLPVQNPPMPEFSAADIVWSRVEGWKETVDRAALIPFTRVNDFVRGESNNKDCPTRFHVEARRRKAPETSYKPKVDGILEYILYWCSFGPDDHRKGGTVRPSRNYAAKRKTLAGRPNTKRGCVCHFIVKRLIAKPLVALVIYNQDKHVDKKGLPCHGPQDKKAAGTQAMFAPYISDELRLQIMSLIHVGVPVETIMQRHSEAVEKQGGPCNRDDLLTHRYVRSLERKIRRSTYELDPDDAVSINMWIENHQDLIFFYEDFSDSEPFILGIQTEWQLQQLITFGNRSLLAADSRFGTNKVKYPIYSLLVFDSKNNAIPVAWIITPNFASSDINRWMSALYDRVHSKDPSWKLGGFIVDDPSADATTIREVFQCSVMISFWRVRHAWHKNLMEKCSGTEIRAAIAKRLGEIVSSICRGNGDTDSFQAFLDDFRDCSDFFDYFMSVWHPRIGLWIAALKSLPLASAEVSAAIECYHSQLKFRLLNEKDSSIYQRADWLVDKLGTKVHSYYWLDEYSGKDNFARYWKDEWTSGLSSWQESLRIPDLDVIVDGTCAKVVSTEDRSVVHTVWYPGSEFALCDCSWSTMGNLCKHVIKSARVYRDKGLVSTSTSLFEYSKTLLNILQCPPHDSVIRDHAIALAVSVQSQLNALFESSKYGATSGAVPIEQPTNSSKPGPTENLNDQNEDLLLHEQSVSQSAAIVLVRDTNSNADRATVPDITQITEASSNGVLHVAEQLNGKEVTLGHHVENEAQNISSEKPSLDSNSCNGSDIRDGSQDGMLVDAPCAESNTGISDSVNENFADGKRMDIDIDPPSTHCSSSTSTSGTATGVEKNIKSSKIAKGHHLDSSRSNSTIIEEINIDQKNTICFEDCGIVENCGGAGAINCRNAVDHHNGPSVDSNDLQVGITQKVDDVSVEDNLYSNAIAENGGNEPLSNEATAVVVNFEAQEDTARNMELDDFSEGTKQVGEAQADLNNVADLVEEVRVVGDSSVNLRDGIDISPDIPSVINGVA